MPLDDDLRGVASCNLECDKAIPQDRELKESQGLRETTNARQKQWLCCVIFLNQNSIHKYYIYIYHG